MFSIKPASQIIVSLKVKQCTSLWKESSCYSNHQGRTHNNNDKTQATSWFLFSLFFPPSTVAGIAIKWSRTISPCWNGSSIMPHLRTTPWASIWIGYPWLFSLSGDIFYYYIYKKRNNDKWYQSIHIFLPLIYIMPLQPNAALRCHLSW